MFAARVPDLSISEFTESLYVVGRRPSVPVASKITSLLLSYCFLDEYTFQVQLFLCLVCLDFKVNDLVNVLARFHFVQFSEN